MILLWDVNCAFVDVVCCLGDDDDDGFVTKEKNVESQIES